MMTNDEKIPIALHSLITIKAGKVFEYIIQLFPAEVYLRVKVDKGAQSFHNIFLHTSRL